MRLPSWTQSGHLVGRVAKSRDQVTPYPENVAYALLLGHLCGQRGEALFQSPWAQLLDLSAPDLHNLAQMASTLGYLKYRRIGNVIEVSFSYLLSQRVQIRICPDDLAHIDALVESGYAVNRSEAIRPVAKRGRRENTFDSRRKFA